MAHPDWPLFDLRIRTPRLELRPPDDADVQALAELASRGIHDPAHMPFTNAWTDAEPATLRRDALRFYWRQRAEWTPEAWHLPMAVVVDGEPVGTQGMVAKHFAILGSVSTGSWIGQAHQGRGIGKEMRAAILHLAFEGLGAVDATSAAFVDNPRSIGVSRALGYLDDGTEREIRRGEAATQLRFRMPRSVWEERRRDDITIEGLEPCLEMFGAQTPVQEPSSSTKASVGPSHS